MFERMSEKHQRCRCIGVYPSLNFFGSPISREFDDYSRAYEFTAPEPESFTNTSRPFSLKFVVIVSLSTGRMAALQGADYPSADQVLSLLKSPQFGKTMS